MLKYIQFYYKKNELVKELMDNVEFLISVGMIFLNSEIEFNGKFN